MKRLRPNGTINIIHTREDIKVIMQYCNLLADENERLEKRIECLEKWMKIALEVKNG